MSNYSLAISSEEMNQAAKVMADRLDSRLSVTLHYLIRLGYEEHQRRMKKNG